MLRLRDACACVAMRVVFSEWMNGWMDGRMDGDVPLLRACTWGVYAVMRGWVYAVMRGCMFVVSVRLYDARQARVLHYGYVLTCLIVFLVIASSINDKCGKNGYNHIIG